MQKPFHHGAVVGKFMPLHTGHAHLIRFACSMCSKVTVVVDCVPGEWPSSFTRAEALRAEFADLPLNVVALTEPTPQEPDDHPEFWSIWRNLMLNACGANHPDVLVCSMDYGLMLSRVMDCEFLPLDINREAVPVSATNIRADIRGMWNAILPQMRVHYITRVITEGAESTGKSTAGLALALKMNWTIAPEWAECLISRREMAGRDFREEDLLLIGKGHTASLRSLELQSNPVLIQDSSLLSTVTWSEFLYGRVNSELMQMFEDEETRHPTERWVFTPETPWVYAAHRNVDPRAPEGESRRRFHDLLMSNIHRYNLNHVIVPGNFEEKEKKVFSMAQELDRAASLRNFHPDYGRIDNTIRR